MISSCRVAVPPHRDRRTDRRRQNRAGRTPRHASRCDRRARGSRESVPRRLLRRPARRRAAGAALLSARTAIASRRRCGRPICSARSRSADYLFDKDKIFAYLNLDDNELFIYQRLYDLLARDVPSPDLVVYPPGADRRAAAAAAHAAARSRTVALQPDDDYLRELNEAYHHFFFHYNATPLLVVETSQFDSDGSDEALDDLIKQIRGMGPGTRYYVPRTKSAKGCSSGPAPEPLASP